jgi:hypothetical protein
MGLGLSGVGWGLMRTGWSFAQQMRATTAVSLLPHLPTTRTSSSCPTRDAAKASPTRCCSDISSSRRRSRSFCGTWVQNKCYFQRGRTVLQAACLCIKYCLLLDGAKHCAPVHQTSRIGYAIYLARKAGCRRAVLLGECEAPHTLKSKVAAEADQLCVLLGRLPREATAT